MIVQIFTQSSRRSRDKTTTTARLIKQDTSIVGAQMHMVKFHKCPAGRFSKVSAGFGHNCAIGESNMIECWGDNTYSQVSGAPTGPF